MDVVFALVLSLVGKPDHDGIRPDSDASLGQALPSCLTFKRHTGGYGGHPSFGAAPGAADLAGDVEARLTEEVDGRLVGEASARRRLAAEAPVLRYNRVAAVPQHACRGQKAGRALL